MTVSFTLSGNARSAIMNGHAVIEGNLILSAVATVWLMAVLRSSRWLTATYMASRKATVKKALKAERI